MAATGLPWIAVVKLSRAADRSVWSTAVTGVPSSHFVFFFRKRAATSFLASVVVGLAEWTITLKPVWATALAPPTIRNHVIAVTNRFISSPRMVLRLDLRTA